jgi:putative component of membrane protein insertase Oxa1/YidC/SpoIIIJ protein YidD
MSIIASVCLKAVDFAVWLPVPASLDAPAAVLAASAVRVYKRLLSPLTGRRCMFCVSCSSRTLQYLEEYGYRDGMKLANQQLKRCGGSWVLVRDVFGSTWMICSDGSIWSEGDLSDTAIGIDRVEGRQFGPVPNPRAKIMNEPQSMPLVS